MNNCADILSRPLVRHWDSLEVPHKQSSKNTTTTKRCTVRLGNIQFSGQERFCSFRCRKEQRNCSVFPLQKGGSGIVLLFPLQKGVSEKVLFYPLKEGGSGKVMFFLLQKGDSGKVLFYPIRCRKEATERFCSILSAAERRQRNGSGLSAAERRLRKVMLKVFERSWGSSGQATLTKYGLQLTALRIKTKKQIKTNGIYTVICSKTIHASNHLNNGTVLCSA